MGPVEKNQPPQTNVPIDTAEVASKLYLIKMNDFSLKPAALGACIAALAVSTGSLLSPQAASALDFTFSFGGVTGLITGLVEGNNLCDGLTPSSLSCVVTV